MTHFCCLSVISAVACTTKYILLETNIEFAHTAKLSRYSAAYPSYAYVTYMIAAALVQILYVMKLVNVDMID
jgi:hypothetical protein